MERESSRRKRVGGAKLPSPVDTSLVPKGVRARALLPKRVDLRPRLLAVRDQNDTSMCVAYASCCMMERACDLSEYLNPESVYKYRADDADGMTVVDAMKVLIRRGATSESGSTSVHLNGFADVRDLHALKTAISYGKVCVVSLPFYDREDDTKFWLPGGTPSGGHAVCIVGYDDVRGVLSIRNSWGLEWCDGGYGEIPYGEFLRCAWEAYSVESREPIEELESTHECGCTLV